MKATALVFVAPRRVELREIDVAPPSEEETLVRTSYSGISSGTEMLAYRGELDPDLPLDETLESLTGTFRYPFSYGYSCVGLVERACGPHDAGSLVFAFHPHQDVFVAPAASLVALGGIQPRVATLFPLVETALQISLDAGTVRDRHVVVVGLGVVGLLTGALLRRAGATVVGVEPRADRRDVASSFGVRAVGPQDVHDVVGREAGGSGVPLVVDASGTPDALASSLDLLAHEGTALVASWYGSKPVPLPLGAAFHRRRLTIRSTQVSSIPARLRDEWTLERRRDAARSLMTELPLERLCTHEFAFTDAERAYSAVDAGEPGLIHAALRYG